MLKFICKMGLALLLFTGPAFAQVSADFGGGGAVAIGTSTTACDGTIEGAIKYDDSENCISFCDGNEWGCITPPTELTMYVTAAKVKAHTLGGRAGADTFCQNNKPANLSNCSNVHAFLSVSTTDAIEDMPANYGYDFSEPLYWNDGNTRVQAGNSVNDMLTWNGTHCNGADTAASSVFSTSANAFTGSVCTGSTFINCCGNWDSTCQGLTTNDKASKGDPTEASGDWLTIASQSQSGCATDMHLYCLCEREI